MGSKELKNFFSNGIDEKSPSRGDNKIELRVDKIS